MLPTEKSIQNKSVNVYRILSRFLRCTFAELQAQCKLGTTELCLSIARLLQENKIRQERRDGNVYYSVCC